ncbi:enoyl-CoA hydratase/isomerase family protein [Nocardioides sp. zg-1228]|uniref:enoyl-CoA hydratase/isomerase family protein n=1 Tax=Nocardioides sp. zg-1228 TaxID=2763008 RepID=UPI00164352BE|nr:enoyl-CoA hydratase/isomerase family protein [Nocardioides sp. zg-1228]MBC2932091.1 enoyl-CoA hydratase/isomerase family protein [Nocardioides sp. zg-1228]QSF57639.1 enoyl-CoA hydratase/isomerase family protein [Nocardioides sp. zg-1228]
MTSDATVLHERLGQVSMITINRPERRNALDPATHLELRRALQEADLDPATRVIVLTGAGQGFCAGGDVKEMAGKDSYGSKDRVLSVGRDLIDILLRLEKPIVAMVNGAAVGLGATIALMCDIVYMADDARIGDRHVNVGLVAGDGGAVVWPLLIGPGRAKEHLLTGRLIDGREAAAMGLVSRAVPAAELRAEVLALAEELAAQPPYALRATKASINKAIQATANQVLDLSLAYEHLSMRTADHQEALSARAEGRPGVYTGQ